MFCRMKRYILRMHVWKVIGSLMLATNLIALMYLWLLQSNLEHHEKFKKPIQEKLPTHKQENSITVIIREFEAFDNVLPLTIEHLHSKFPSYKLIAFTDSVPYPPIQLPDIANVAFINLNPNPDISRHMSLIDDQISSKYVMIVPDGIKIPDYLPLDTVFIDKYKKLSPSARIIAMPIGNKGGNHLNVEVNLREWTLKYSQSKDPLCTGLWGNYIIFMQTSDLLELPYPLERPFLDGLFIQTALRDWKVSVVNIEPKITFVKDLYSEPHDAWKLKSLTRTRHKELYKKFGIKYVVRANRVEEWHGCSKDTERCFGTVHDETPSYIYAGKWTPPCCLQALRLTGRHVFNELKKCNARFWLEGGSLLGAARNGDIIPWDYDIDIGIYKDDIRICKNLKDVTREFPFIDDDGFIWEKAKEGEFYRVQYSETNHLHVDIFPFYPKDNHEMPIMTKDTWFKTHRQDTEFPEHYLKPFTNIDFIGVQAPAPNHVREFLELKFGKGVIEKPEYPNPAKIKLKQVGSL
ncbi:unnamed protein product [Owenia fusiformis]|uniref:Fukutin-related protein n=1 Tax=Owenia fusiformis TaxID=6347 RepID=A0A8S4PW87_OWEFU|nr:unnamed protein product [Owenia fusiformis]